MEELKITRERAIKRMEWILKHEIYCSDKLSHAAINMAITALRSAEPENKALTLFSAITESPEALAKFLRAVDVGKIKLSESFCKSDCGDDDGCPHELQCIINWLNQPYARKPEGSNEP